MRCARISSAPAGAASAEARSTAENMGTLVMSLTPFLVEGTPPGEACWAALCFLPTSANRAAATLFPFRKKKRYWPSPILVSVYDRGNAADAGFHRGLP